MKLKFLIAGMLTLGLCFYQLLTDYSRTGLFNINISVAVLVLAGVVFLIFSKKEGNKFVTISVWLNLFAILFYLIPISINPYVRGEESIPFLFFGPLSFGTFIFSIIFMFLGIVRYFENKKVTTNNRSSNFVH